MVHVPRHPYVGNLCHPSDGRLSPVVATIRNCTPVKEGQFSHTWTLSKSSGGLGGVGSTVLHSERNLSVKSDVLLNRLESLFMYQRPDMAQHLKALTEEIGLPSSFFGPMTSYCHDESAIQEVLSSATSVPMATVVRNKLLLENSSDVSAIDNLAETAATPLQIAHKTNFRPNLCNLSKLYSLSVLQLLIRNYDIFSAVLATSDSPVMKYLRTFFRQNRLTHSHRKELAPSETRNFFTALQSTPDANLIDFVFKFAEHSPQISASSISN